LLSSHAKGLEQTHLLAGTRIIASQHFHTLTLDFMVSSFRCFLPFQIANTALGTLADEDFDDIGTTTLRNALRSAGQ